MIQDRLTRRHFLGASLAGVANASLVGCAGKAASSHFESTPVRIGVVNQTDSAPFVIAQERGHFDAHGIRATLVRFPSWAAIRDALVQGDIQAAMMLYGMPLASTMGLLGSNSVPMVVPWQLNRNGGAVTIRADLRNKVDGDPKSLKPIADRAREDGEALTFSTTFPPGTHAMLLRYWLAAGGIHPDRDVRLITLPPPQMVANMRAGLMDGYCVGEPWNARAVHENVGFTALGTQEIWRDHPEKVCAFTRSFAERDPRTVKGVLKALYEASVWLDAPGNHLAAAQILARPGYVNGPVELIAPRMLGHFDYGDGRFKDDPIHLIFNERNCNYPQRKYGLWFLTQFRRWGLVEGAPDYAAIVDAVMRPDLFEEAMREIGVVGQRPDNSPESLFDGTVFDPTRPEEYAGSFAIHSLRG